MAKILVSDTLAPQGLEILEHAPGIMVIAESGLKGDELLAAVADIDGVVIRSGTQVTAEVGSLAASPGLRWIQRRVRSAKLARRASMGRRCRTFERSEARASAFAYRRAGSQSMAARHTVSLSQDSPGWWARGRGGRPSTMRAIVAGMLSAPNGSRSVSN